MASANLSETISIGGASFRRSKTFNADVQASFRESLAAAKSGTLTLRTDDDTGEMTLATGHGVTTGQRIDVYWSGGSRRGMTVGTVAGDVVPIDGGSGDNLPTQDDPVTAMVPTEIEFQFTGNNAVLAAAQAEGSLCISTFVFATSGDTEVTSAVLDATNGEMWNWNNASGAANPFAGSTVAKCFISHNLSSAAQILKAGVLRD